MRNQLIAYLLKDYWGKIKFDNLSKNNREIIKSKMYKLYKFYKKINKKRGLISSLYFYKNKKEKWDSDRPPF